MMHFRNRGKTDFNESNDSMNSLINNSSNFLYSDNKILLIDLANGESAKIIEINGGKGMLAKLSSLGIIVGETITKVSSSPLKGPVILQKGKTQVAIGYGMAKKIIVEKVNNKTATAKN
jgi:ferrous iron transport protein A